jgi:hypothetical protein
LVGRDHRWYRRLAPIQQTLLSSLGRFKAMMTTFHRVEGSIKPDLMRWVTVDNRERVYVKSSTNDVLNAHR